MHETEFSFFNLESPNAVSVLPGGGHALRGWIWPKPGHHIVDVRARVADRIHPGVHGIPRADLAAHFKTGPQPALAEFIINVTVAEGDGGVQLEALLIDGRWRPFHTFACAADRTTPPAVTPPSAPLRWHEYGRMLEALQRARRHDPDRPLAELARDLVRAVPTQRALRHPPLPFHGHLDEPAAFSRCGFGRTAVLGWLFHETMEVRRVLATFDLQAWQTVAHGRPSPGPGGHFSEFTAAANAGLFGIIDVPAQLPSPATLRLYAELTDGSLHLCGVQRTHLVTNEEEKAPYAPGGITHAHDSLQRALSEAGFDLTRDAEFDREIDRIATDHALRVPKLIAPVAPIVRQEPSHAPTPGRVLFVTHNLNYEGAPLFLADLIAHHARQGSAVTVLSPEDGPLRTQLEAIGAHIRLTDVRPLFAATDRSDALAAIAVIGRSIDFSGYDLVIANTFTTFWAVHAAKAANTRVLLYVHESTTPAGFYHGRLAAPVIVLADEAFGLADHVAFTTASTRSYHLDYGKPSNHRLVPGWIDVARIDRWAQQQSRPQLRADFNLPADGLLVSNVGTVCDRKGQHIFARAIDLFWRRHPALARVTRFVMLGGGQTPFDAVLADLLAQINRPNIEVHPATADYLRYYAAADLFVCSTYEESSPRVILETMAMGTPILSSGVQGVPEQVTDGVEAVLVAPGDTLALCDAMARLLQSAALRHQLAAAARARVVREFDSRILLPRHAALAAETAAGQTSS
ncbi:MAG: glycosyltransferase family 4 protein [Opitutaceae bacterium]